MQGLKKKKRKHRQKKTLIILFVRVSKFDRFSHKYITVLSVLRFIIFLFFRNPFHTQMLDFLGSRNRLTLYFYKNLKMSKNYVKITVYLTYYCIMPINICVLFTKNPSCCMLWSYLGTTSQVFFFL